MAMNAVCSSLKQARLQEIKPLNEREYHNRSELSICAQEDLADFHSLGKTNHKSYSICVPPPLSLEKLHPILKFHEYVLFDKPPNFLKIDDNLNDGQSSNPTCVISCVSKSFRPKYKVFTKIPEIHWMSFRGFHLSPFLPTPVKLKEYTKRQKAIRMSKLKFDNAEEQVYKFCFICKQSFSDPKTHFASKEHKDRLSSLDWSEFDLLSKTNLTLIEK